LCCLGRYNAETTLAGSSGCHERSSHEKCWSDVTHGGIYVINYRWRYIDVVRGYRMGAKGSRYRR
jgi:hypothetical protein